MTNQDKPQITVVHLITGLESGGAESVLAALVAGTNNDKIHNVVISMTDKGFIGEQIEAAGVELVCLNMKSVGSGLGGLWRLIGQLKRLAPDVLLTWLYHADLMGLIAGKIARVPKIIWNIRCSNMDDARYSLLTRTLAFLSPLVDMVIANSNAGFQAHKGRGYHPPGWKILRNGIDTNRFKPDNNSRDTFKNMLGIDQQASVVGLVARFDPMKDHATFFKAAASLGKTNPHVHFVLIGEGVDNKNADITGLISGSGLEGRVSALGPRKDMESIYPAFDALVLSSAYGEGFPNVLAEGMAAGVIAVATNVGDVGDIIDDTGIVVPPKNPALMTDGLNKVLAMSKAEREEKSIQARKRIVDNFSLKKMTDEYENIIDDIVTTNNQSFSIVSYIRNIFLWRAKIAAKLVLSRLPIDYAFWKRLSLFEHGKMNDPEYAFIVFTHHFEKCRKYLSKDGFSMLETGPGDSLMSAMLGRAFGAAHITIVDVGYFAGTDMAPYRKMAQYLRSRGLDAPSESELASIETMLSACNTTYLTNGLNSLGKIKSNSVDFIFSQAVLEHVRKCDFAATMAEHKRILRDSGVCSHNVDLRDHLGGALNNLRFSERVWESELMASSGFYTNRIQYSDMLELFSGAGFKTDVISSECWQTLPTPISAMNEQFSVKPEEELRKMAFHVLAFPDV